MNPIPPLLKTKGIDNMKMISRKESVILTATEKAVLDKAFEILDEIATECENYDDLYDFSDNARDALEDFLSNDKNIYEVEPLAKDVAEVIVKITL